MVKRSRFRIGAAPERLVGKMLMYLKVAVSVALHIEVGPGTSVDSRMCELLPELLKPQGPLRQAVRQIGGVACAISDGGPIGPRFAVGLCRGLRSAPATRLMGNVHALHRRQLPPPVAGLPDHVPNYHEKRFQGVLA
eukprot:5971042-Amphidinium_carterae.1